ncbi:hypothetical protein BC751_4359 [Cecembia calidifontis]|jgi:hypothetical protein|uniref:Uncharacterized protein n=1 Tax=Cecembia calidifontis TaxID=1187080 RepID=A0A4Q7PE29_9BACT|nr:hypothetical protein BC751_4359 [Cecembia calidifontis]
MDFKAFPNGFTKSMKVINPFYIRFWFLLGVQLYLFIYKLRWVCDVAGR